MSQADKKILVLDIGGTNVKMKLSDRDEIRKFPSGKQLSAQQMVDSVIEAVKDWSYDLVTVGYPGVVRDGRIEKEPVNLGKGWVGFNFEKAFHRPVKLINDAAMQAVGSYEGGRMLFLGLGTGLGSCLIADRTICPMELGHLPYRKKKSFEEWVGAHGLETLGRKKWEETVHEVITMLRDALVADYVVLGGGNAKKLKRLPEFARLGHNDNAFIGGVRLWTESFGRADASSEGKTMDLSPSWADSGRSDGAS